MRRGENLSDYDFIFLKQPQFVIECRVVEEFMNELSVINCNFSIYIITSLVGASYSSVNVLCALD